MPESSSPWYMSELYRQAPIKFALIDRNFEIVQANSTRRTDHQPKHKSKSEIVEQLGRAWR